MKRQTFHLWISHHLKFVHPRSCFVLAALLHTGQAVWEHLCQCLDTPPCVPISILELDLLLSCRASPGCNEHQGPDASLVLPPSQPHTGVTVGLLPASLKHFQVDRQAEELTLETWSLPSKAGEKMDERAAGFGCHQSLVAQGCRGALSSH